MTSAAGGWLGGVLLHCATGGRGGGQRDSRAGGPGGERLPGGAE